MADEKTSADQPQEAAKAAGAPETADAPKAAKKTAKKAAEKVADKVAEDKAEKVAESEAKPAKKTAAKKSASATKAAAKPEAKPAAKTAAASKAAASATEPTEPALPVLKAHHLRPAPGARTAKTRVGRGEGSKGKTAGRGTKGTKARYQVPARLEGGQMPMHMRLPKLRGFKNPFRTQYQVVNVERLEQLYPEGGEVTVGDLVAKGAVRPGHLVKVLGDGAVSVRLSVQVDAVSASARSKILAAGGSVSEA